MPQDRNKEQEPSAGCLPATPPEGTITPGEPGGGREMALDWVPEAVRVSEEKYRKLHESMMDAFVSVAMDGHILESNRAYREMLGYTAEELAGLTYVEITPPIWHEFESRLVAEQIIPRGFTDPYEKEYRRKDGSVFPVELRTFLIRNTAGEPEAMWAIVRDISERKQAEQALREWNETLESQVAERTAELERSKERFRHLVEATFEGISISEGGKVIDCNPQLARIFGYEMSEITGRQVEEFAAPQSRSSVEARLRNDLDCTYEFIGLRKDGSTFPAEVRVTMRTWLGRRSRCAAIRDLTAAKEAESRLRAKQAELDQAQRMALVGEISVGIVHQILQPLTAMGINISAAHSNLEACASQTCGSKAILDDIKGDISRMRHAVTHLRALADPNPPTRVPVHFNDVVEGIAGLLRREAVSRQIDLEVGLGRDLPSVPADSVQMSQVVLNLVRNAFDACEACPPERRTVSIMTRTVDGGAVEIQVRDSGAGISPEAGPRLFSPFFSTKPDGIGIGLRLSQTIVQSHGGHIEGFNNSNGPGATFRVVLSVSPDPVPPLA